MKKLIIFDLDGVIIDSEPLYNERFLEYAKSCGLYMPKEEVNRFVGSSHGFWERIKELNPSFDIEKTHAEYESFKVLKPINYQSVFRHHTIHLLNQAKAADYLVALASSSSKDTIKMVLSQCGIIEYFDLILSGKDLHVSKPHPMIFNLCAQMLEVSTHQSVVIEDSENGILAGYRAGMKVIAIRDERFIFDYSRAHTIVERIEDIDIKLIDSILED